MSLRLEVYRLSPDSADLVVSEERGLFELFLELEELDSAEDVATSSAWRSAFDPEADVPPRVLELGSYWDCLSYHLDPERRARGGWLWEDEVEAPLSGAVIGRRLTDTDGEGPWARGVADPIDRLRINGPDEVRESAAALRVAPALQAADPTTDRRTQGYRWEQCAGAGPDAFALEVYEVGARALVAFYSAAEAAGESTLHTLG